MSEPQSRQSLSHESAQTEQRCREEALAALDAVEELLRQPLEPRLVPRLHDLAERIDHALAGHGAGPRGR